MATKSNRKQVTITMGSSTLARAQAEAGGLGMSLSEYISQSLTLRFIREDYKRQATTEDILDATRYGGYVRVPRRGY